MTATTNTNRVFRLIQDGVPRNVEQIAAEVDLAPESVMFAIHKLRRRFTIETNYVYALTGEAPPKPVADAPKVTQRTARAVLNEQKRQANFAKWTERKAKERLDALVSKQHPVASAWMRPPESAGLGARGGVQG